MQLNICVRVSGPDLQEGHQRRPLAVAGPVVGQQLEQLREEVGVQVERRHDLHVVELHERQQRGVGGVVQAAGQDNVLDVLDAVRLVDLGLDLRPGGAVDAGTFQKGALSSKQQTQKARRREGGSKTKKERKKGALGV